MKERLVGWVLWGLDKQGNPGLLPWAFQQIRRLFSGEPDRYFEFLVEQSQRKSWLPVFFAAHELGELYPEHPREVVQQLLRLSGESHDLVRQGAARSWSRVLEFDFDTGFRQLQALSEAEDYESRQTAALGPVRYYDSEPSQPVERSRIRAFWKEFREDPRSGLRNLVRTEILEPRATGEANRDHE